jgi:hypothetical protein
VNRLRPGPVLLSLLIAAATGCSDDDCVVPMATATDLQAEVFQGSCALSSSCHDADGHKANLDLSSVAASCAALDGVASCERPSVMRVVAGDPDRSYLYQKLTCADVDCTPTLGASDAACPDVLLGTDAQNQRMPYNSPTLAHCEFEAISGWITSGLAGCP